MIVSDRHGNKVEYPFIRTARGKKIYYNTLPKKPYNKSRECTRRVRQRG